MRVGRVKLIPPPLQDLEDSILPPQLNGILYVCGSLCFCVAFDRKQLAVDFPVGSRDGRVAERGLHFGEEVAESVGAVDEESEVAEALGVDGGVSCGVREAARTGGR